MKSIRLSASLRTALLAAPLTASACLLACITTSNNPAPSDDAGTFDATLDDTGSPPATDSSAPDTTTPEAATPPNDGGSFDSSPPPDVGVDAPGDAGPTTAIITGQVFNFMQLDLGILPGATVSVMGGPLTTSDAAGRFTLPGVPPGRALVNVSMPVTYGTFSSTQLVVPTVAGQTVQVTAHLLEGCSTTIDVSPTDAAGTTLQAECSSRTVAYASISFDPGALTESGTPFTGTALVEIIPVESPTLPDAGQDLTWFETFPGDMSASQLDGGALPLQSLGACEFRVSDATNGALLTIATGHTATLAIPAYRLPVGGETFTGYYYDAATGHWVEQGPGTFTTVMVGSVSLPVFQIQVPDLTWWNIDEGSANEGCVIGTVTSNGAPVPGLLVSGTGVGWGGGGGGVTASDGTFCLNGLASSPMNVTATAQSGGVTFARSLGTLTTSAAGASCGVNPGSCANAGAASIVPLQPLTPGCVTGKVFGTDGAPLTTPLGIQYNYPGGGEPGSGEYGNVIAGTLTAVSDGSYCLQYPVGVSVTLLDPTNTCVVPNPVLNPPLIAPPPTDGGTAICPSGCTPIADISFFCSS